MIIAIDPDLDKSGVAILDDAGLKLYAMSFVGVMELLQGEKSIAVIIEAGWQNAKSNFHGGKTRHIGERIAKNVGENHAVGKIIAQVAEHFHHKVILVTPKTKKTPHDEFCQITGYKGRTNSEKRDAGMIAHRHRFLLKEKHHD